MRKGVVEYCVLGLLAREPMYGWQLADALTASGLIASIGTLYPLLARRALFDAVAGHKTPQEGVIFSNDLFPAAQRFPWQAGPRVTNDWAGLEHTLRGLGLRITRDPSHRDRNIAPRPVLELRAVKQSPQRCGGPVGSQVGDGCGDA